MRSDSPSAEKSWPDDPGAPEHVLATDEAFQQLVNSGGKLDTAVFVVTDALEKAGFSITRWPVQLPECPMHFPPDRCSGCRATLFGLPHAAAGMQNDPTVSSASGWTPWRRWRTDV